MTTTYKRIAPLVFGLFALFAANAYAGFFYEATTVTKTDSAADQKTNVSAWSEGASTRIEFTEGDKMGFFGPGSYLVSTDAGETLYLVNPNEKTYALFDMGAMMGAADAAMKSMGGMMKMEIVDTHFEKVSEAPGGDILGYSTQRVKFNSGYTLSLSIMGQKMDQVFTSTQDLWLTPAVDAAAFNAWMRPDKMMKGMFKGMSEMIEQQYAQVKGAPLKSVIETHATGGMGGESKTVMTTEVTTLRKETIPASTFAIPDDYKKTELIDELAREEGGEQNGPGLQESMSKLKVLFGGQ